MRAYGPSVTRWPSGRGSGRMLKLPGRFAVRVHRAPTRARRALRRPPATRKGRDDELDDPDFTQCRERDVGIARQAMFRHHQGRDHRFRSRIARLRDAGAQPIALERRRGRSRESLLSRQIRIQAHAGARSNHVVLVREREHRLVQHHRHEPRNAHNREQRHQDRQLRGPVSHAGSSQGTLLFGIVCFAGRVAGVQLHGLHARRRTASHRGLRPHRPRPRAIATARSGISAATCNSHIR